MSNAYWDIAWLKETKDLDFSKARIAGRSTKANPDREDAVWWMNQGSICSDRRDD
jgi:hypothetical protein